MNLVPKTTEILREKLQNGKQYLNFINGKWVGAKNSFEAVDPSIGKPWAELPESNEADVNSAVQSAQKAFKVWSKTSLEIRQEILLKITERFEQNEEKFAPLLARENGRPIREAFAGDIPAVKSIFRYFAGVIRSHQGNTIPTSNANSLIYTVREPLGVIAAILPWNSPLITLANKMAPTLAAGNTLVVKPSEFASASVLEFIELIEDLLPAGVINIVCGHGTAGAVLSGHQDISKLTFTGGPETARRILQNTALTLTPSLMELGGKGAMIVAEDANLEIAVQDALSGIFTANGEACIASSRLLLHEKIYDEFVERFVAIANKIKVGDALDFDTEMGPLVSSKQFSIVKNHVQTAVEDGIDFLTSNRVPESDGFFQAPLLLADDNGKSRISRNEVFGPVTVAEKFSSYSDAVSRANRTRYGLAAGIWTNDLTRAHSVSRDLEAGIIWVNKWFDLPTGMPMGGVKDSGFGRETALQTLDEYSSVKSVNIGLTETRAPIWAQN